MRGVDMEPSEALRTCSALHEAFPACPECGSWDIEGSVGEDGARVSCRACGARTLAYPDEAGAADEWNASAMRALVGARDYWFADVEWGVPDVENALRRGGYDSSKESVMRVLRSFRFEKTLRDRIIEEGQEILDALVDVAMREGE